mgnify:CR=1 FL=1
MCLVKFVLLNTSAPPTSLSCWVCKERLLWVSTVSVQHFSNWSSGAYLVASMSHLALNIRFNYYIFSPARVLCATGTLQFKLSPGYRSLLFNFIRKVWCLSSWRDSSKLKYWQKCVQLLQWDYGMWHVQYKLWLVSMFLTTGQCH